MEIVPVAKAENAKKGVMVRKGSGVVSLFVGEASGEKRLIREYSI